MNEKTGKINSETLQSLKDGTLLVDTSLLIPAIRYPEQFGDFFAQLGSVNCATAILPEVRLEFISSNRSIKEFQTKRDFISKTIKVTVPASPDDIRADNIFLYLFGRQSAKFNAIDYLQARVLRQRPTFKLITANHTDFTSKLFDIESVINFITADTIITFGICSFSSNKYLKALKDAMREYKSAKPNEPKP